MLAKLAFVLSSDNALGWCSCVEVIANYTLVLCKATCQSFKSFVEGVFKADCLKVRDIVNLHQAIGYHSGMVSSNQ